METIDRSVVEATWQTVARYSPEEAFAEQRSFTDKQPTIVAFILQFTEELDQDVQQLALYLAHVVWKIFESASPVPIPPVLPEAIVVAFQKWEKWFSQFEGIEEKEFDALVKKNLQLTQPNVIAYTIEALMEESEDSVKLSDEDMGYLFWLLLTVVDVLDQSGTEELGEKPKGMYH